MEDTARPKCLNILCMITDASIVLLVKWKTGNTSYSLYCFLYLKEPHYLFHSTGSKYPHLNHSLPAELI